MATRTSRSSKSPVQGTAVDWRRWGPAPWPWRPILRTATSAVLLTALVVVGCDEKPASLDFITSRQVALGLGNSPLVEALWSMSDASLRITAANDPTEKIAARAERFRRAVAAARLALDPATSLVLAQPASADRGAFDNEELRSVCEQRRILFRSMIYHIEGGRTEFPTLSREAPTAGELADLLERSIRANAHLPTKTDPPTRHEDELIAKLRGAASKAPKP
jgi:hypothetical protein